MFKTGKYLFSEQRLIFEFGENFGNISKNERREIIKGTEEKLKKMKQSLRELDDRVSKVQDFDVSLPKKEKAGMKIEDSKAEKTKLENLEDILAQDLVILNKIDKAELSNEGKKDYEELERMVKALQEDIEKYRNGDKETLLNDEIYEKKKTELLKLPVKLKELAEMEDKKTEAQKEDFDEFEKIGKEMEEMVKEILGIAENADDPEKAILEAVSEYAKREKIPILAAKVKVLQYLSPSFKEKVSKEARDYLVDNDVLEIMKLPRGDKRREEYKANILALKEEGFIDYLTVSDTLRRK